MIFHNTSEEDCDESEKDSDYSEETDKEHDIPCITNTEDASELVTEIEGRVDKM